MKKIVKVDDLNAKLGFEQLDFFKFDVSEFTDKSDKIGLFSFNEEPYSYLTYNEPSVLVINTPEGTLP